MHPLRERHVEPLAKIGDAILRFFVALFAGIERFFEGGELASQRRDLLVEHLDLRQRAGAEPSLRVELPAELGSLALSAAGTLEKTLIAIAFALRPRQTRAHQRELLLEVEFARLFER